MVGKSAVTRRTPRFFFPSCASSPPGSPIDGESQRIGQELPEIGFKACGISEEFLDPAGQRIGTAQAMDGHAINRLTDRPDIAVRTKPIA